MGIATWRVLRGWIAFNAMFSKTPLFEAIHGSQICLVWCCQLPSYDQRESHNGVEPILLTVVKVIEKAIDHDMFINSDHKHQKENIKWMLGMYPPKEEGTHFIKWIINCLDSFIIYWAKTGWSLNSEFLGHSHYCHKAIPLLTGYGT